VPVADLAISQRPAKSLPGQTLLDDRIFIHIQVVVAVDESISERLAEHHPNSGHEKYANTKNRPVIA